MSVSTYVLYEQMYMYTNFMCNLLGCVKNFSIRMCMLIVLAITIHLLLVINMSTLISCHCFGELWGDCDELSESSQ